MDDVVQQLLNEVRRVYNEHHTLTDDILSALHFIFQAQLLSALDLIDRHCVSLLASPSGRQLYRELCCCIKPGVFYHYEVVVIGSSGVPYICFVNTEYCECPAYRFSVLQKGTIMCKHVLAAKLSEAMGVLSQQSVTNEHISALLKAMS